MDENTLGQLLGALTARPGPVPKYLYPSAGTLYPVQAYLSLRQDAGRLARGSYYHDPDAHALALLSSDAVAAPDGTHPAALLLFVAQRGAIEPIYGEHAETFCLLEAGYIEETLRGTAAAAGLALRDAGDPSTLDRAELDNALQLDEGHMPLVCWAIEVDE